MILQLLILSNRKIQLHGAYRLSVHLDVSTKIHIPLAEGQLAFYLEYIAGEDLINADKDNLAPVLRLRKDGNSADLRQRLQKQHAGQDVL